MLMYNVDCSFGFGVYKVHLFAKGSTHKKPFSCCAWASYFFTVGLRCRHDMNQTNFWSCSHMVLNINFVTYVASNHSFFTFYRAMMCLEKAQSSWTLVPVITFFLLIEWVLVRILTHPNPQIKSPKLKLEPGKGKGNGNKNEFDADMVSIIMFWWHVGIWTKKAWEITYFL